MDSEIKLKKLQTGAKKCSINETFGGHFVFYVVYLL